jgi:drug/metabolite transporter (DMT)-like permease
MNGKVDRVTLSAFALIILIAGSNFVAVKFSNQELAPFWGAALRFFSASFLLFIFIYIKHIPIPKGRALAGALIYGVVGFGISYALLYWALLQVPAAIASVIIALVPLFTFFLAIVQGLENFRIRALLGSLVAALGIVLIFYEQLAVVPLVPLIATVAAAVFIAETGIIVKLFPKNHPAAMNALGMAIGAMLLLLFSLAFGEVRNLPIKPETLIAFFYLTIVGSVILFALVIFVLKRWTASAASYQLVLAPLVTLVLASLLRGEAITFISLVGSLIVIIGVYVGALATPKK